MRTSIRSAVVCVIAGLAGCVSPTPYAPAQEDGGYGYSDFRIEPGKYRIVFRGNTSTSRERVENYVCYRAAELAVLDGFDYFVVVDADVEVLSEFRSVGTGVGVSGFGPGYAYSRRGGFYSGAFYGSAFTASARTQERRRYWAAARIEARNGEKPDLPNAYDARAVLEALRDDVLPPRP
ncbi:MAG: hypothetical protein AAF196_17965 [Planctomycetota bacterium]